VELSTEDSVALAKGVLAELIEHAVNTPERSGPFRGAILQPETYRSRVDDFAEA
jgi:hypothetical protein